MAGILLEHWDPLFVADTDVSPESEYLFEAKAVLELLDNNSELTDVRSYLVSSSRELNPSINTAKIDATAQVVWDFYWSSDEWTTRQPPLVQAALRRDPAAVTELIAASVSPDQATPEGFSALHAAASKGFDDIGRLLLEAGANVDARDTDGWTPLLLAASQERYEATVALLLDFGADPNAEDFDEMWRPLTLAAESCRVEVARLLITAGADGSWVEPAGQSPLASAIRSNCPAMVELLLAAGADPKVKGVAVALERARHAGLAECVALLDR